MLTIPHIIFSISQCGHHSIHHTSYLLCAFSCQAENRITTMSTIVGNRLVPLYDTVCFMFCYSPPLLFFWGVCYHMQNVTGSMKTWYEKYRMATEMSHPPCLLYHKALRPWQIHSAEHTVRAPSVGENVCYYGCFTQSQRKSQIRTMSRCAPEWWWLWEFWYNDPR